MASPVTRNDALAVQRLLAGLAIGVGLGLVGLFLFAAFVQPPWLLDTHDLHGADLATARNNFRGSMLAALAGLAVIAGAVVGALNFRQTQRQFELQRRGQVSDRFSKAIEQLGKRGDPDLDVRIGAVYALEQIARDSDDLHGPIMELLTAYLREHAAIPSVDDGMATLRPPDPPPTPTSSAEWAMPADHQAIATVIGRRRSEQDPAGQRLNLTSTKLVQVQWAQATLERADLAGANLAGAWLRDANLKEAYLPHVNLERAKLLGAELEGAYLEGANLEGALLHGANLRSFLRGANLKLVEALEAHMEAADLEGANLEESDLRGTNLKGANLQEADLERAILARANLEEADLRGADLRGANLWGANLKGANLEEADLRQAKLEGAKLEGAIPPREERVDF